MGITSGTRLVATRLFRPWVPAGWERSTAPVVTQPAFGFGTPVPVRRVFPVAAPSTARRYDLPPDGRIVSVIVTAEDVASAPWSRQPIDVVLNWTEELKARVKPH